ncbi:MAG TPA: VOC family protein [Nitrospira sp.]|nr:VOC family protein [Nitrospira sp.]
MARNPIAKHTICLRYDNNVEDAARFYPTTFPDSAVCRSHLEQEVSQMPLMCRIITVVLIFVWSMWPSLGLAGGEEPAQQPSARERLNQVLSPEGGIQVYKDQTGAVESTINLPNGERIITVQPPQGAGLNLGPPLQLNNPILQFPPQPTVPAQPPTPEFPQRAR